MRTKTGNELLQSREGQAAKEFVLIVVWEVGNFPRCLCFRALPFFFSFFFFVL